jgi:cysteine-rich repeat protein
MTAAQTTSPPPVPWRILRALALFVVLVITSCSDEPAPSKPAGPVCDQYDVQQCDCPYGQGFSYCREDGTGFGQCECAIREATTQPDVTVLPSDVSARGSIAGERDIELPLEGSEAYLDLPPGSYVLSWELGIMGQVLAVDVAGGSMFIRTAPCTVTDVFETLDIEYAGPLRVLAHLPDDIKAAIRQQKQDATGTTSTSPGSGSAPVVPRHHDEAMSPPLEPAKSGSASVDLSGGKVPGLSVDLAGEYDLDVDLTPLQPEVGSFLDYYEVLEEFAPNIFIRLRLGKSGLNHFAILVDMDPDVILQLSAVLEMKASLTTELDLFKLIAFLVTGQDNYVLRTPIGAGFDVETYAIIGSLFELDANVRTTLQFDINGAAYAGICYSADWDDEVWDEAPGWFQEEKAGWSNLTWQYPGYSDLTTDVMLTEFVWGAHGGMEFYLKPKWALSFFRCGGPTFDVQPYLRFDAWVGSTNELELSGGVRGHLGGKIEVFGTETLWEDSMEIFAPSYPLLEYTWMMCGDGVRTEECSSDCTDKDYCHSFGCGGTAEECDAGLHFLIDGQGYPEGTDDNPCIQKGANKCTCKEGWVPAQGDEPLWDDSFRDDWRWGASNNWCLRACGNGKLEEDEGEVCDDGNTLDWVGDCSADCKSTQFCGDGIVQPENFEACDDGNNVGGDGCRADCRGFEVCGDDLPDYDAGEDCDDGNTNDCDSCGNDCTWVEGCGDGHKCGNEQCDDGNWMICDGCSSDCKVETGCGDGIVCDEEACDDANTDNCDGCTVNCTLTGCGDGFLCGAEVCDDGNNEDCDGCNYDCTPTQGCGDGVVCTQIGEQCEDGNADDCDACHNDCTINTNQCGDGHACGSEACDDGDLDDCDACHNDCTANLNLCGDAHTCGLEDCDDGNTSSGDGCRGDCLSDETCGNGVLDDHLGEVCDDGNNTPGDGCNADCSSTEICGNGVLDTGESCEDDTIDGVDQGCTTTSPDCVLNCGGCTPRCGDGVVGPGETCEDTTAGGVDDGCTAQTPGCSADCKSCGIDCSSNTCGDGVVCPGETCDDQNTDNCDGCNNDCQTSGCGDGYLCAGEVCDDGNTTGGDGCRADCQGTEQCGDGLVDYDAGESCEDTSTYGTDLGCFSGSPVCNPGCVGCVTEICSDGIVQGNEVCDGNVQACSTGDGYLGEQQCLGTCNGWGFCVATEYCGDGATNGSEACDDGDNDSCTLDCSADCEHANLPATPTCGDTILECGEACDDGNTDDLDGCSADCLSDETCGNGYTDTTLGEMCDDGNTTSGDGCTDDCSSDETCGNGVEDTHIGEVCDDGNTDACVGTCTSDCSAWMEAPVCGDTQWDAACEVCEDTSQTGQDAGCTASEPNCLACGSCSPDICGDGVVTGSEVCDDGGNCNFSDGVPCTVLNWATECPSPNDTHCFIGSGDGCRNDCLKIEVCGDGIIDPPYESCDDSAPDGQVDVGCDIAAPNCDGSCSSCSS